MVLPWAVDAPSLADTLHRVILGTMRWLGFMIVCLTAALMAGCPPKAGQNGAQGANGANWPFWPTRMRFHPLTRLVKNETTGQWVVEARIEFFDSEGANTKAAGQLAIQLFAGADSKPAGDPIQVWNQDLHDLELNHRQYDDMFHTYLFRLEVDPAKVPEQIVLQALFVSDNGVDLDATLKLRR